MEEYAFRPDSCGAGEFRGGIGLVRQYRILADDMILQVRADRTRTLPYGLFGGGAGAPSRNILDPEAEAEDLPGKFTRTTIRDTVIRHEQAGGGGFGDPLRRDLAAIAEDVRDGKVSRDFAVSRHGVVFGEDGLSIDRERTEARRVALRQARDDEGMGR